MSKIQAVWIDAQRCTGCGACVDTCPVGAIALLDSNVTVNQQSCTGCGACLDVCTRDAIQLVVEGELVPAEERAVERHVAGDGLAPAIDRSRPLVEAAGPAVAAVGIGLLARTAEALARAMGRWLAAPSRGISTPAVRGSATGEPASTNGQGRRRRHRQRGR